MKRNNKAGVGLGFLPAFCITTKAMLIAGIIMMIIGGVIPHT